MKPILFCSFLLAFFSFSCKPKPIDNLKEVARQAEENKVKRVSRAQLGRETQRVADSVLKVVFAEQQRQLQERPNDISACLFSTAEAYRNFKRTYNGNFRQVRREAELQQLQAELAELRKYRNELSETEGKFPATFQTLTDSLLYVRPLQQDELICALKDPAGASEVTAEPGFWVMRVPKQKFVEIMTVKVKPKPEKGPNW